MLEKPSTTELQFRKHRLRLLSKMRRRQSFLVLLLACLLLLTASPHSYHAATNVQGGSRPREASESAAAGLSVAALAKGNKTPKAPSGPNPVGNQHPPSRP